MIEEMQVLIDNMLKQADFYLSKQKEFYPFGGIINNAYKIIPLGVYLDSEQISSEDLIKLLEKAIFDKFLKKEIIVAAIAVDVNFRNPNNDYTELAIQVKILHKDKTSYDCFLPYKVLKEEIQYKSLLTYSGTLNI